MCTTARGSRAAVCETRRGHCHIGLVRPTTQGGRVARTFPAIYIMMASWRRVELGERAERAERARGGWGFHLGHGHGTRLGGAFFERLVNAHGASAEVLPSATSTPSLTRQQLAELLSRSSIFSISCRAMGVQSFRSRARVKCASCRQCERVCHGPAYSGGEEGKKRVGRLRCPPCCHST